MSDNYSGTQYKEYMLKIRELQKELPQFCREFFRGIESRTLVRTRYAYAVDLNTFFRFAVTELDQLLGRDISSLTLADLEKISVTDIERYLSYVSLYSGTADEDGACREYTNQARAKARKLATLRSLYKYFYKKEKISINPPSLVDAPVIREKEIIRLEPDEVAKLLDMVESGSGLTDRQQKFHERTKARDLAILTLFLGTGIRISELVGIDMDDINFSSNEFSIIRKGGKQDVLVFGDEVREALLAYMLLREKITAEEGHENALFLSLKNRRITVRSVENLVKKYALITTPQKNISPHKLRSTFGTSLYAETGDIYLVGDVLGHKDINTTKKHYAAISKDRRRRAAEVIKLRDDDE